VVYIVNKYAKKFKIILIKNATKILKQRIPLIKFMVLFIRAFYLLSKNLCKLIIKVNRKNFQQRGGRYR